MANEKHTTSRPANLTGFTPRQVSQDLMDAYYETGRYDFTQEDWYKQAQEQYGNTEYWKLISSMPGLQYEHPVNGWDTIGRLSKLWTPQAEADLANQRIALQKRLSDITEKNFDINYQDPAAEVARNNAAGLNSDLLGVNGQEAPGTDKDDLLPQIQGASSTEVLNTAASVGVNLLNMVMSLGTNIQGFAQRANDLKIGRAEYAGKVLGLFSNSREFLVNALAGSMPVFDKTQNAYLDENGKPMKNDNGENMSDIEVLNSAIQRVNLKDYPKEIKPYLRKMMSLLSNADDAKPSAEVMALANEFRERAAKAHFNTARTIGDPLYYDDMGEMLTKVGDFVNDYIYAVEKAESKYREALANQRTDEEIPLRSSQIVTEQKENKFNQAYFDELNTPDEEGSTGGKLEGLAEKKTYALEILEKDFDEAENQMWSDLMKFGEDNKNKWWGPIITYAVPILRTYLRAQMTRAIHVPRSHKSESEPMEFPDPEVMRPDNLYK